MRVSQKSSRSFGVFWVVAVALGLVGFFLARFVPKGTALESARTAPTPDLSASGKKVAEPAEPPPDRPIRDLVRTWNQGDAENIARLFIADGTIVMPAGSELRSSAEIAKTISEKRAGVLKQTILTNTVEKVSRPDPDTAVVQGTYKLDGIRIMGLHTSASGSYTLRQVKREGRWFISRAEITKGGNG